MDQALVDLLNKVGAGTFIVIVIGIGALMIAGGTGLYNLYKLLETKIRKNTTEEMEETQQMDDIKDSITKLEGQIGELTEGVSVLTTNQESFITKLQDMHDKLADETRLASRNDDALNERIESISKKLNQINEKQSMLIESDKINIRSTITEAYYKSTDDNYIDPHTLQNLEDRYQKYLEENGNAFAGELMNEMRKLPHAKPE